MSFLTELTWMDVVELTGLLVLPVFLVLDLIWRDKRYDTPSFWRGRAALVTLFNFHLAAWVSVAWAGVFAGRHLLDWSGLGVWAGAAAGVLVYELGHYAYHRTAHRWEPLWRASHQMHHSAEAVDAFGAFYLHPLDNAFFTTIASLVYFPLLGLSPEAGVVASVFVTFNAVFQHANIRTPRWIGYFIQRPESHRIHHARGIHRHNYADLPLWDMVFGTFRNPAPGAPETKREGGFYKGASSRVTEMLVGFDVSVERSDRLTARKRTSPITATVPPIATSVHPTTGGTDVSKNPRTPMPATAKPSEVRV